MSVEAAFAFEVREAEESGARPIAKRYRDLEA